MGDTVGETVGDTVGNSVTIVGLNVLYGGVVWDHH